MVTVSRFAVCLVALVVMCLLPFDAAWSADEDTISQVYLEFDPETGEFKTALDPSVQATNQHAQSGQLDQIQQGQEGLDGRQPVHGRGAAAASAADRTGAPGRGMLIGVVGAALVLGAFFVLKRRGRQRQS